MATKQLSQKCTLLESDLLLQCLLKAHRTSASRKPEGALLTRCDHIITCTLKRNCSTPRQAHCALKNLIQSGLRTLCLRARALRHEHIAKPLQSHGYYLASLVFDKLYPILNSISEHSKKSPEFPYKLCL